MSAVLEVWNTLPAAEAETEIRACCGSRTWSNAMVKLRPVGDRSTLLNAADEVWQNLDEEDWREAFLSHPRIGESRVEAVAAWPLPVRSANWSEAEQSRVAAGALADDTLKTALAEANREYEAKFGHIFIVCASGKGGPEILKILRSRLVNDPASELREAAEQQRQITRLRLEKWLAE